MDKEFEELIERAAADMTAEDGAAAITALAEGLQVSREEMSRIALEELGYEPTTDH